VAAPQYLAGNNGVLASNTLLTFGLVVAVMVMTTAVATAALIRGRPARPEASAVQPAISPAGG
jgi:hypothetical protein